MRWFKMPCVLQHLKLSAIEKAIVLDIAMYQDYETGLINSKVTSLATTYGINRSKVSRLFVTLIETGVVQKANSMRTGKTQYFWVLNTPLNELCDPNANKTRTKRDPINKNRIDRKNIYTSKVEQIYHEYPKKQGKATGTKKLIKYLTANPNKFDTILQASKNYAKACKANNTELRYIKQFSTWVNQECWDDMLDIPESTGLSEQDLLAKFMD